MPSTRNAKRQTRLAFTPLPSSSPQASELPSALRSRAAAINYDGIMSTSKKRKAVQLATTETPPKQPKIVHLVGPSDPKIPASTKAQPNMSSSPPLKRSGSAKHQTHFLPTPAASSQARNGNSVSDSTAHASSGSDSSLPSLHTLFTTPTKPRTTPSKSSNGKKSKETNTTTDDEEDDMLPYRSARAKTAYHIVITDDEDSDDGIPPLSSVQRSTPSNAALNHTSPSSSRQRAVVTPSKQTQPLSSPRRTRSSGMTKQPPSMNGSARRSTRLQSRKSVPETGTNSSTTLLEDSSTNVHDSDDDSDVRTPTRSSRRVKHPRRTSSDLGESETSGDLQRSRTKKTRLVRPVREPMPTRRMSKQEEEDLEEDLEILQDTEVCDDRTRGRAAPTKRQAAQKQLDILRARRAGQASNPAPDSHPSSSRVIRDTESESGVEEESEEYDAGRQTPRDDNDDYDDGFVVDDGDGALGAPLGLEDIPLEFTRHAHKKPKEHFKDAVEWMLQKKLNPAFSSDDPIYRVAFHKLEDEVRGYAGSKFVSAAWAGDFARALKARPEYSEVDIPPAGRDYNHCDACNRTNHPAKVMITFAGKPYHPETLETLSDDEDEDDRRSRDVNGNPVPPADKQYFVGSFCKANAAKAHSLLHWRLHLYQWILDWLKTEGYTSAEKLVEREEWSTKKRREYANRVVDEMEEKGQIASLWRDFKINLEEARTYKGGRFR